MSVSQTIMNHNSHSGDNPPTPVTHTKGCNTANCCSPAKLWRTLQQYIKTDDKKSLHAFFNKDPRIQHIVRVALTSRITNDSAMYPPSQQHKLIRIVDGGQVNRFLGKSFTDLNSLQFALLTSSESTVLALLNHLQSHATKQEVTVYLNHVWGQGNTSLHLAVYLKRHAVVKTLLDLGCTTNHLNARRKNALDCCFDGDKNIIKLLSRKEEPETSTIPPMTRTTSATAPVTIKEESAAIVNRPVSVSVVTEMHETYNEGCTDIWITESPNCPRQEGKEPTGIIAPSCLAAIIPNNETVAMLIQLLVNKILIVASTVNSQDMSTITQQQYLSLAQQKKPPDIPTLITYVH